MSSGGAGAGAAMLASAATTMATAAFGAMMVVGMRGCAAEPSGASHPVHPAAAAAAAEPEDDGSAALRALSALRAELKAATLAGLCQQAEAAGVTGAEVERALRNDPLAAQEQLISLVLAHGDGGAAAAPEASDLQIELQELKLTALHKRALSAGVAAESVEAAMDSSDPKGGLIGLIVDVESRRGPADRVRSCLEGGGEACAEMITGVLDHAMEVLEGLSVSSPRKARKGLFEIIRCFSRLPSVFHKPRNPRGGLSCSIARSECRR